MSRQLASIQKIVSLEPIKDADQIEKATVLGWSLVVKKTEFKVGDLCIYIEIDSILPEWPEFEFLRSKKFKIKTIKLRGQISQGIAFPISTVWSRLNKKYRLNSDIKEGDDVTDILEIRKYDPEAEREKALMDEKARIERNRLKKFMMRNSLFRKVYFLLFKKEKKSSFPPFIKKTDEDRIQLFPNICEQEKDTIFDVTEKLDGQSATYFAIQNPSRIQRIWKPYIFGVCSRNFQLFVPDNSTYWNAAKKFFIEDKLVGHLRKNKNNGITRIVLQGEILAPKVQGNKYAVGDVDFYAFNLITNTAPYKTDLLMVWCKANNIKHVPILDTSFKLKPTISEMVEYAKGKSVLRDIHREGVVIRNYEKNISFKVINPLFLLAYQDEDEANQKAYRDGTL